MFKQFKPQRFEELLQHHNRIIADDSIPFSIFDTGPDKTWKSVGSYYNRPKTFSKPIGTELALPPTGSITAVDSSKKPK